MAFLQRKEAGPVLATAESGPRVCNVASWSEGKAPSCSRVQL